MKKLLGISLIAVFAVVPLLAYAEVDPARMDVQPTHANPQDTNLVPPDPNAENLSDPNHDTTKVNKLVAQERPQYALKEKNLTTDGNVASAGYVKGAYNAAIRAINRVAEDAATKMGTVNTINNATVTSVPNLSVDSTISGSGTVTIDIMDDWESDTVAVNGLNQSVSFNGATITNTVSGGITSTIHVDSYNIDCQYGDLVGSTCYTAENCATDYQGVWDSTKPAGQKCTLPSAEPVVEEPVTCEDGDLVGNTCYTAENCSTDYNGTWDGTKPAGQKCELPPAEEPVEQGGGGGNP